MSHNLWRPSPVLKWHGHSNPCTSCIAWWCWTLNFYPTLTPDPLPHDDINFRKSSLETPPKEWVNVDHCCTKGSRSYVYSVLPPVMVIENFNFDCQDGAWPIDPLISVAVHLIAWLRPFTCINKFMVATNFIGHTHWPIQFCSVRDESCSPLPVEVQSIHHIQPLLPVVSLSIIATTCS